MSRHTRKVDELDPAQLRDLEQTLLQNEGFRKGYESRGRVVMLGRKLRQLREQETDLSQRKAAALLGMTQPELSRIETGTGPKGPSFATLDQIIEGYTAYIRATQPAAELRIAIDVMDAGKVARSYCLDEVEPAALMDKLEEG